MKPTRLISLFFCIAAVAATTGCASENGPDYRDAMLSDIVTVVSSSADAGTIFSFQRYDDTEEIILSARGYTNTDIEDGTRVLLYYYPESGQPYTSGPIKVRSLQMINNGSLKPVDIDGLNWDATPVWLNSVWRTGRYLNFRLRLSYSEAARHFSLVADKTTLSSPMPDIYLAHDLDGQPESYLRESIASFDISDVWNLPTCTGITLHINDTNLKQTTYSFTK